MKRVDEIIKIARLKKPDLDEGVIRQAYLKAARAHKGQVRYTGDKYITHPVEVAKILAEWGMGEVTLVAALLHDTVEDTEVTLEELDSEYGADVARLVDGVTKLGKVKLRGSREKMFVENLRKMFVAMAADIRVVMIRLADRLHNMRTLEAVPLRKQKRIAEETLHIYAPLAERLGMGRVKTELEDLAFMYVDAENFEWLMKLAKPHFERAEEAVERAKEEIETRLKEDGVEAEVHGRAKGRYSLFCKLKRPGVERDISKIFDLVALRIITKNKGDCYAALGIVHDRWKPVPSIGVSDFVAQPKPNGYQSIHTKVFDDEGRIMEVQIRTKKMHEQAELGAAAHYAYAEAKSSGVSEERLMGGTAFKIDEKMNWVEQLANWQREVSDSREFVEDMKLDALSHRIYVFSPKGDVYDLPAGATPVDFACLVHGELISYLKGAKVNGRVVPLDHGLQSGDLVEIIKTKNKREVSKDWLEFVKTRKAKDQIGKLVRRML